jgi:hypothetical protein
MKFDVISAFIDKRTGRQVNPGEPMPEGLDRDTLERLVAAQCLRPLEPRTPTSGQADKKVGGGTDLFPDEEDEEDEEEEDDNGQGEGGSGGEVDAGAGRGGAPAGQSAAPGAGAPNARRPRRAPAGTAQ